MKTLIQVPGNGDCLFNSILIGYVDSHNGQYPIINGIKIRTQYELREAVRQYYQDRIDVGDETLITCLKGMLIDIIKLKNFSGFSKARSLKKALEDIRSQYDAFTEEQDREEFLNININLGLIQLYVDNVTSIWGSWQEAIILRDLLGTNIRLSDQGTLEENEIEVAYVGGNHYNAYINNPNNIEVLALINAVDGSQAIQGIALLRREQILKISTLSDYQFHLFLQIIFNKRDAEQSDINNVITDEEVTYATEYLRMHKVNLYIKKIIGSDKLDNVPTEEDDLSEDSPLKPKKLDDMFAIQRSNPSNAQVLTSEEKYQLYYDDTSSEEGDQEELESTTLALVEERISSTKGNFKGVSKIDLALSFLAHEFGIRILKSKEVGKYYYSLKAKYLAKNKVLSDEQLENCIKKAIRVTLEEIYQEKSQKIFERNNELVEALIAHVLANKRNFIKTVKKDIKKIFPDLEDFKLPVKQIEVTIDTIVDTSYSIYEDSKVDFTPNKPEKSKTKTVWSATKTSKIAKYAETLPLESLDRIVAEKLAKETTSRNLKTLAEELKGEVSKSKQKFSGSDSFVSTLSSKLLTILKEESSKHNVYRKTLPTSFEISLESDDVVAKFFANLRLTTVSAIRMIKNFEDHHNILEDQLETMTRSFSFLGLENKGVEKQTIYKETGSRSDFVEVGKVNNSGKYISLAIIIEKMMQNLKVDDIKIAQWIMQTLKGQGQAFITQLMLNDHQKESLEKFINSLTYLLFGTEVVRNPASLIIHYMMLELIIETGVTWKIAFEGKMPMSIKKAVPASRVMHNKYNTSLQYSYDKAKDDEVKNDKVIELITKEAQLFKDWLKLKGIRVKQKTPISEIIDLLSRECSKWYEIEVRSRQLVADILLEKFEDNISEDQLNDLSIDQLMTLEEIASSGTKDDLLRLHDGGDGLSLLAIIKIFQESEKKFEALSREKVIDFYNQLQEWEEDISFEDIGDLYDSSEDKLWDLINYEEDYNLIRDYGFTEVSETYDAIYNDCGGNSPDYTGYDEDGEEYNIYIRVSNRLLKEENGSDSDKSNYDSDEERIKRVYSNSDNEDDSEHDDESEEGSRDQ